MNRRILKGKAIISIMAGLLILGVVDTARADVVTDWNQYLNEAVVVAKTSSPVAPRVTAIVQTAVFDAINGIKRRYTPIHVDVKGPRRASYRAAAVQAAYVTLVALYPEQQPTFDAQREASLASLEARETRRSIDRGIAYGQLVADDILLWRSTDGFVPPPPPFLGGMGVGQWRPTPPGLLPGAAPQLATMTPWALVSPSQFRPAGPPALTSAEYTADFDEVREIGKIDSTTRTADQTEIAVFWAANTVVLWNRIAASVAADRHLTSLENARLLALVNIASADAVIACWDAKYTYVFWRPVTAIPLAATDGNPATAEDPGWLPLLVTPAFPEYTSGHATLSGAAATVLALYFGDEAEFTFTSETAPNVQRSYTSFTGAADEANESRIYGGIHFRSACRDGRTMGDTIGSFVSSSVAQPRGETRTALTSHNH